MAKRPLNVGLIGGGAGAFIVHPHQKAIHFDATRRVTCAALHPDPKVAMQEAENWPYSIKGYRSYDELIEQESKKPLGERVDYITIVTPNNVHFDPAMKCIKAGIPVFCEKPLAHSCAQAREIRELGKQVPNVVTQVGSQGGATDTFRRSMEVIQAGVLGEIREVHVWMDRGCPPSTNYDKNADPIPPELNWDFWCGPSKVLPFKNHYLGFCLHWGPWLEFGDGHLADMGAHGLNLPWRALKLTAPKNCSVRVPEPVKDSYPSSVDMCWDFAARDDMPEVKLWWHDGGKGPPDELGSMVVSSCPGILQNSAQRDGARMEMAVPVPLLRSRHAGRPSQVPLRRVRHADRQQWRTRFRGRHQLHGLPGRQSRQ